MCDIRRHYITPKTILRKCVLVSPYFVDKYTFSPYVACQHACKYCDGRAEKYYVEGDFEKDIRIRKNAPEILDKELSKLREKGTILIGSGISDPYQPIEEDEGIMRQCLDVISKHDLSVSIMTKSSLINRDLDILEKINKNNSVTLMVSLTFLDDKKRLIFEPYASPVEERINTLKLFKEKGMYIGVLAMPFIPYVSDSENDINDLVAELSSTGIDFIMPGELTLRPGRQKEIFIETIKNHYPQILKSFLSLYSSNKQSGAPSFDYRKSFSRIIDKALTKHSISSEIPHYIYKDSFPLYDEIYILLNHMTSLYKARGINTDRLVPSVDRYKNWLTNEKKIFNRRRKLMQVHLEEKLLSMFDMGDFDRMLDNGKLKDFICDVALKRKCFDYFDLKLM